MPARVGLASCFATPANESDSVRAFRVFYPTEAHSPCGRVHVAPPEKPMIQTRIKLSGNVAGLGDGSQFLFQRVQMAKLGEFAINTVKARVARGIGSDDQMMPALTQKRSGVIVHGRFVRQRVSYAEWKSQHGLQPIRDMRGTGADGGNMMDNLTVRSASENRVVMALTSRKARAKAIANERRTPFLSFSAKDEAAILEFARQMFATNVEVIARQMWGSRRPTRASLAA